MLGRIAWTMAIQIYLTNNEVVLFIPKFHQPIPQQQRNFPTNLHMPTYIYQKRRKDVQKLEQADVVFACARICMVRMYILANHQGKRPIGQTYRPTPRTPHQENQVQNCNFISSMKLGTIEILRFNAVASQSKTPRKVQVHQDGHLTVENSFH